MEHNYWKYVSIILAILLIGTSIIFIFAVIGFKLNMQYQWPLNIITGNVPPTATISGPVSGIVGETLTYTAVINSPQSRGYAKTSIFWADKIYQGFQDSWTNVSEDLVANNGGTLQANIYFPGAGTYWVMVNVNDNRDVNNLACTGNPTYSKEQLMKISLFSCGSQSYLEVNIIDSNYNNSLDQTQDDFSIPENSL